MKKSDFKKIVKPIVKECIQESIHEILLESGILSSIISEVVTGLSPMIMENRHFHIEDDEPSYNPRLTKNERKQLFEEQTMDPRYNEIIEQNNSIYNEMHKRQRVPTPPQKELMIGNVNVYDGVDIEEETIAEGEAPRGLVETLKDKFANNWKRHLERGGTNLNMRQEYVREAASMKGGFGRSRFSDQVVAPVSYNAQQFKNIAKRIELEEVK